METKYCPSCGQDVPLDRTLEGSYVLICCEHCGLGLGVQLASAEMVRQLRDGVSPDVALDNGEALGRVKTVKRQLNLAVAVEKPAPPDPRSGEPSLRPQPARPSVGAGALPPSRPSVGAGAFPPPRPSVGASALPPPRPSVAPVGRPLVAPGGDPGESIGNSDRKQALAARLAEKRQRRGTAGPQPQGSMEASVSDESVELPSSSVSFDLIDDPSASAWERATASAEGTGEAALGGPVSQMKRVMVVEDSEFLRTVTRDLLKDRRLASETVDCADGQAFLEAYTKLMVAGEKVDLVVLDVRMPGIDGRQAAYAQRAIERALKVKATPILFFSAVLCDAEFKADLKELTSARYVRKAEGGDVQELGNRIVSVLERLVGGRPV